MEVISKQDGRKLVLALSGELDHHGAHMAISQMNMAVEAAIPRELTLDFSGVSFMDSSGIALVVRARQQMSQLGGQAQMVNVPPQAKKVFDAAGICKLVPILEGSRV